MFIVHLEGRKRWKVYEPTLTYPTESMRRGPKSEDTAEKPTSDPYLEVDMTPGDVIYIPRGHWHYAVSETPSIHLTVGAQARVPAQFLRWLADKAMWEEEYFRRDFPIIDAGEFGGRIEDSPMAASLEEFREQVKRFIEDQDLENALTEFIMTRNSPLHSTDVALPGLGTLEESLDPETVFEFPDAQKALVSHDPENDRSLVLFRGEKVAMNGVPETLLTCAFDGRKQLCGRDLMDAAPGSKWEDVSNLLKTLHERKLLRLAH